MNTLKQQLKKKKVWIPLASVAAVILLWAAFGRGGSTAAPSTAKALRGPVTEAVFVTGAVKSSDSADLAFEKSGKVSSVRAAVGSHVYQGQLLASLEGGAEYANVQSAEAKLRSEQARLAELSQGARPEDIAVTENDLAAANLSLSNSLADVSTDLLDAFNKADNAVNRLADPLFTGDQSSNPQLTFSSSNQDAELAARKGRTASQLALRNLETQSDGSLSVQSSADAKTVIEKSIASLSTIQDFFASTAAALAYQVGLPDATAAAYRDNINTARTNITAAISSLKSLEQEIGGNEIAIAKINSQLALKKLGSTTEVIAQEQAAVDAAAASVLSAKAAYAKDFMYAPVSGTITRKDIEVGEIASANNPIITLQTDSAFRLEANVPEADIAKIAVGNSASTTLDAYGESEVFAARVISVDPAEKVVEGVATYKVTLDFAKPDARIRSGMTANITIVTNRKSDVVSVPQRAVVDQDGKKVVRVLKEDGTIENRTVATGLRGADGSIEIISGIKEGETVVTFLKQ